MKKIIIHSEKHGIHSILLDDDDFIVMNRWKWSIRETDGKFYAVRRQDKKTIRMHRQLLGVTDPNIMVDHKDHDGRNNQRSNIRIATFRQNACNVLPVKNSSSKYLGVSHCNRKKCWQVQICMDRKRISLGRYYTEEEAALAYNAAAIVIHGEFASLNKVG